MTYTVPGSIIHIAGKVSAKKSPYDQSLMVIQRFQRKASNRILGQPVEKYCADNKEQFATLCNDHTGDSGQQDFCSVYGTRCRGWKPAENTIPTTPSPDLQSLANSNSVPDKLQTQDNVDYCKTYGSDYYKICLRGAVAKTSRDFCHGFSAQCPGVPKPGTNVETPQVPPPATPGAGSARPPGFLTGGSVIPPLSPNPIIPPLSPSPVVPAGNAYSPYNPGYPAYPGGGGASPMGLGWGSGVAAPFFGGMSGTQISPFSGVGQGTALNAAGIGVSASRSVNWDIPGLRDVGSMLGGKK